MITRRKFIKSAGLMMLLTTILNKLPRFGRLVKGKTSGSPSLKRARFYKRLR